MAASSSSWTLACSSGKHAAAISTVDIAIEVWYLISVTLSSEAIRDNTWAYRVGSSSKKATDKKSHLKLC